MTKHARSCARAAASATALLATLVAIGGAQGPSPDFRVDTELVVVDLVATDRTGRFIDDLQPSDIELLEDGKPQKVLFARLVRVGQQPGIAPAAPSEPPAASASPGAPVSSPTAAGKASEAVAIAIVLDMASIPPDAMGRVREAILDMIGKEVPADSRLMLATVSDGVNVHQTFTTDRSAFRKTLETLPAPAGNLVGFAQLLDVADQLCDTAASMSDRMPALEQMISLGKMMLADWRRQFTGVSDGLKTLARSMAATPGRKHVVLYSTGYALDPATHIIDLAVTANASCAGVDPAAATAGRGPASRDLRIRVAEELSGPSALNVAAALQSMLDRANRSQVSFYTIDPRGLTTTSPQASQRASARMSRGGQLRRFAALETTLPQEFLRAVAGDTGGRAFLNTNDLAAGLRRAWADASEYYLIGYRPAPTPKPGTYHKIELKLRRPDLDLRYRRGYYSATPKEIATSDIEQALRMPGAFEQNGLEIDATFTDRGKLRIVAFIPPRSVRFTPSDRTHVAEISVHATLRDEKGVLVGGKPLFGRDITLRLSDGQLESLLKSDNVEIPVEVDPPSPAKYRLTVVARERGGWIGARTIDLTLQR